MPQPTGVSDLHGGLEHMELQRNVHISLRNRLVYVAETGRGIAPDSAPPATRFEPWAITAHQPEPWSADPTPTAAIEATRGRLRRCSHAGPNRAIDRVNAARAGQAADSGQAKTARTWGWRSSRRDAEAVARRRS